MARAFDRPEALWRRRLRVERLGFRQCCIGVVSSRDEQQRRAKPADMSDRLQLGFRYARLAPKKSERGRREETPDATERTEPRGEAIAHRSANASDTPIPTRPRSRRAAPDQATSPHLPSKRRSRQRARREPRGADTPAPQRRRGSRARRRSLSLQSTRRAPENRARAPRTPVDAETPRVPACSSDSIPCREAGAPLRCALDPAMNHAWMMLPDGLGNVTASAARPGGGLLDHGVRRTGERASGQRGDAGRERGTRGRASAWTHELKHTICTARENSTFVSNASRYQRSYPPARGRSRGARSSDFLFTALASRFDSSVRCTTSPRA